MCNFRERNQAMNDSGSTTMEIETSKSSSSNYGSDRNGHVVISVYGNFDRKNIGNVFEGITPLFQEENKGVTMDLEGVTQIAVRGLRQLLSASAWPLTLEQNFTWLESTTTLKRS